MKVAVMNFSGNVGKSTVARHVLAPRIAGADVIAIETINADGSDAEHLKGKQFGDLQQAMSLMDAVVVDIGASNVEDVVVLMRQYRGSHDDFDYFVIPTVPDRKQQRDTIATINALTELGVPAEKLRMVFNMVEADDDPARVFASLFQYHADENRFVLRPDAVLHRNEVYTRLGNTIGSLQAILADPTDYKARIKETSQPTERLALAQKLSLRRLAAGVVEEHDAVFRTLFQ